MNIYERLSVECDSSCEILQGLAAFGGILWFIVGDVYVKFLVTSCLTRMV